MKKLSVKIMIIFLIIAIPITIFAYKQYENIKKGINNMYISLDKDNEDNTQIDPNDFQDPLIFLLLGIGDRPDDPGRADAIIVASVNPKKEEILTFNIPRDTKTEIIGKGIEDKINHSYAFGDTKMTVDTVEHFLGQSIDYVVQVNMQGLRDLVDTLGEIEVDNPFYFYQGDELGNKTYHYEQGRIKLDGEKALHYSRMRKRDPRGDFGRNDRQKQVIQAILEKAKSPSSILKIEQAMDVLSENIKTNISFDKVKTFYQLYTDHWHHYKITNLELNGEQSLVNGIYYYIIPEDDQAKIQETLFDFMNNQPTISHTSSK